MELLVNPEINIDINLLNDVSILFKGGNQQANEILTKFKEREDAWTVWLQVLDSQFDDTTKFLILSILNNQIKKKWQLITLEYQLEIKENIVSILTNWNNSQINESLQY